MPEYYYSSEQAYDEAKIRIAKAREAKDKYLSLSRLGLTRLPSTISDLCHLRKLVLDINMLTELPQSVCELANLNELHIGANSLMVLPENLGELTNLTVLRLRFNSLANLPASLGQVQGIRTLDLGFNPLNPELSAVYDQGLDAVMTYLRAKAADQIELFEAKLILVGEGEVGKTCLLGALKGEPFREGLPTTHGIEIKSVEAVDAISGLQITLNGWDFGGQRVYRPTHQLFFSSPAVYLVVWKPREGSQQGFVEEWIRLIKHREPDAKILVVGTHGGPNERQPNIDRQVLRDRFGGGTIVGFHHVDSFQDGTTERVGIEVLKADIARIAVDLPEVGRTVPKHWQEGLNALKESDHPYVTRTTLFRFLDEFEMDEKESETFVGVQHRLGHLIHYENDPALRDIVILKPHWLAKAISYVLDDMITRKNHGLASKSHLTDLWADPSREADDRYPMDLHPVFIRLMERFDLSYRVPEVGMSEETSLIAQLVPDTRPDEKLKERWPPKPPTNAIQKTQVCRIVDESGDSATAEGLFYQLIVRLHKYSLGRECFRDSIHWQRGLVLDADYNGLALIEHVRNDIRITVRAAYPQNFLAMLTEDVRYLVSSFWEGLECHVMVDCLNPLCEGMLRVANLIDGKKEGEKRYPCTTCGKWQPIDTLLTNVPSAQPAYSDELISNEDVIREIRSVRSLLEERTDRLIGGYEDLKSETLKLLSMVDASFNDLTKLLTDEAKEGPRLFSLEPVDRAWYLPSGWGRSKFRLTLWCEHSRLPLPFLNDEGDSRGVFELELEDEWMREAAPWLRLLFGTLGLVLPIAASGVKMALEDEQIKQIEAQLDLGRSTATAILDTPETVERFVGETDRYSVEEITREHGFMDQAEGGALRQLQVLLKAKDPGFGGLVRVLNKRNEFLWVHEKYVDEY